MHYVAVDFETWPIENRPDFPPEPVGVAYKFENRPGEYLAWGHETCNNCSREFAELTLFDIFEAALAGKVQLVFHNAKFDLSVAYERLGLPVLPWSAVHDTAFLAYLLDPHARKLDLKSLAAEQLDWPADEKDAVAEWVWENRKRLRDENPEHTAKFKLANRNHAPRWYPFVPGDVLAPYAIGDVERTLALFGEMAPDVKALGMQEAYDRERQLLPILMENERDGMCVDVPVLRKDIRRYTRCLKKAEDWLRDRLDAPDLNLDADAAVAEAFSRCGIVDDEDWVLTGKSKQRSISKDNLPPSKYQDQEVASVFGYRNRLVTTLKMFMLPWLEQAERRGGFISTNWNQIRGGAGGTRTGRPSTSNPNFLNLAKTFDGRTDGYQHPDFLDVLPLPKVRRYIVPDEGHVFLHRDFSGQEVRVFAHFEQGELCDAYITDPALDPHSWLKDEILALTGVERERTKVKNVTFLRLYGGGRSAVVAQLQCSLREADELLAAHDKALPGRRVLVDEITRLARRGEPVVTWGGRLYLPEPPARVGGQVRDFEYKLINYLIQGSAADVTKEVLIRWYNHPERDPRSRFLVTVYDEINISCPEDCWEEQMDVLRRCMDAVELDVPMRSEGAVGPSWAELEACA